MSQRPPPPRNRALRFSQAAFLSMNYTTEAFREKRAADEAAMQRWKEELGPDKPRIINEQQ